MTEPVWFRIDERDDGSRVDDFCASRFGNLSRMRIATLITAGACLVNGNPGRAGHKLAAGDLIEITFEEGAPTSMSPEDIPLEIVFEDDQVLVVVKPAGMLVHPTMGVKTGTLANALAYHLNKSAIDEAMRSNGAESSRLNLQQVIRPGLVHRLDRATSGLMVIAKTARSLATLSRHFRKRLVKKRYVALVWGTVKQEAGCIDASIGRDPESDPQWRVMDDGKTAETRFSVLQRGRKTTLLELEPVTGRTNQLRIHSAHIGHPIVGDQLHGFGEQSFLKSGQSIETEDASKSAIRNSQFPARLCLHASQLAFHHPVSGEWLEFESAIPGDFATMCEWLL